jgi:hypothetical protein
MPPLGTLARSRRWRRSRRIAEAFSAWIAFGSIGLPSDNLPADRKILRKEIDEAEPLAKLSEAAGFEADVAAAVVEALSDQLPDIRSRVLVEAVSRSSNRYGSRSRRWKLTMARCRRWASWWAAVRPCRSTVDACCRWAADRPVLVIEARAVTVPH